MLIKVQVTGNVAETRGVDPKITKIEIRLEILEVIWKWNRHCHNHCYCPLRKNGFGVEIGEYFAEEVYLFSRFWQGSWMCENGNDAEIGLQELTIINIESTRHIGSLPNISNYLVYL